LDTFPELVGNFEADLPIGHNSDVSLPHWQAPLIYDGNHYGSYVRVIFALKQVATPVQQRTTRKSNSNHKLEINQVWIKAHLIYKYNQLKMFLAKVPRHFRL
jgi:hypothetical protein